jgi:4'-phosphopantetheinyl transferase EntD
MLHYLPLKACRKSGKQLGTFSILERADVRTRRQPLADCDRRTCRAGNHGPAPSDFAGDECALLPQGTVSSSDAKVRRASGAARIAARELLGSAGCEICAVPNATTGAQIWPSEIVGSLAHDSRVAVAAVARSHEFANIGIDIEPAEALPSELLKIIATSSERLALATYAYGGRLLFAAKEAAYKAVADLDRKLLDHHDVEVDFHKCRAVVRNGRTVELRFCISTHLLVLAFVRRTPAAR